MKKNIVYVALASTLVLGSAQFFLSANADGMPYEPVFESMPITESITTANVDTVKTTSTTPTITKVSASTSNAQNTVNMNNSVESNNLQNALMQLDGAQVEIRNQLLQYKTEYTDLDNQYKVIKEQRAAKAKQVRETEKKIKDLDSTKEKIRKNMN